MKYNFISADKREYQFPENLTRNRGSIEGKILGCLVSDLSLFMNCSSIKPSSFLTPEGYTFFMVLKKVFDKGATQVDLAILDTVLSDSQMLRENFMKYNGFNALKSLERDIDAINFDTYLSDYSASNSALDTYKLTVEIQLQLANMTEMMTNDELESYVDFKMNEIRKNNVSDTGVHAVEINDEYIQGLKDNLMMGVPYGLRMVSNTTMGLHYGNLSLLSMNGNQGKSTIMFTMIAMDLVDHGEKVLLYCNESEYHQIQELLLVRTLRLKIRYFGLNRTMLAKGKFNAEHEVMIAKARAYIKEHYSDMIYFKKANKYSVGEFLSIMRRYTYRGVRHFFLDTYKSENAASDKVRGELIDSSRRIYETCRALDVNCFATYQTKHGNTEIMKRLLDLSILSEAKAVADVLDVMIGARHIYSSEYTGERHDIKPYIWKKNEQGKYIREYITLNPEKKYIVMNVAKNRYGINNLAVLYENQYEFGLVKEVGLANIVSD